MLLYSRAIAGLLVILGSGGGCVDVLGNGNTAFRTSLLLQKNEDLELAPGGVVGRSVNLGFSGVLSSCALLCRSGCDTSAWALFDISCAGGFVSRGTTSISLVRTLAVLEEPPPLGSLFSRFLWNVSAAMTVRSSSDISETCNSFMKAIN